MSTVTAQILIGSRHPNHGGIMPTHQMLLHENSRPAWEIFSFDKNQRLSTQSPIWIPTVEHMLEDGILMATFHAWKLPSVVQMVNDKFHGEGNVRTNKQIQMYEDFTAAERDDFYAQCRTIDPAYHMVLSVLEGSSVYQQLGVLQDYNFGVEVCTSAFVRGYSSWIPGPFQRGTLPQFERGMRHE